MCQSNYNAKMLIGKDMDVLAALGDKETKVTLDTGYGDIVGISIGETYTRSELGQVNLSLKVCMQSIKEHNLKANHNSDNKFSFLNESVCNLSKNTI